VDASKSRLLADPVTLEDHAQGRFDADVTLVQYGDYECPDTRIALHSVHALLREFQDQLLFVFRHFPLVEIHPPARWAAAAAEAAAAQGEFWRMHEHLFQHQHALTSDDLHQYAMVLGLDLARFDPDRVSSEVAARIERDVASGARHGIEGTPTFYINRVRHTTSFDVTNLRLSIMAAARRSNG
jgi:protein-disulfide isomerase